MLVTYLDRSIAAPIHSKAPAQLRHGAYFLLPMLLASVIDVPAPSPKSYRAPATAPAAWPGCSCSVRGAPCESETVREEED